MAMQRLSLPRFSVGRGLIGLAVVALIAGSVCIDPLPSVAFAAQNKKKAPQPPPPPPAPKREVVIGKVDLSQPARKQVMASAAKIDELVAKNYDKYKVKKNPKTSDAQFLRRVYLDITGTIPTAKQTKLFLVTSDPEKRPRLIDNLLNKPGYASNFYNFWGDILRLSERLSNNAPGRPYNEYIMSTLEKNTPYDVWVKEMVTAQGKYLDNPATGFIVRDSGMPLDAMNNTIRIFLGTQIGCAQCHNHPFDKWTQKEFYQMAAFTFGTQTRRGGNDKMVFGGRNVVKELNDNLQKVDSTYKIGNGKYNRFLQGNLIEVFDTPNRPKLPHDYQYDDAKPLSVVQPKTILPPLLEPGKTDSPRVTFANWLTSKDNSRFTKAIANRLWAKLFGVGQIEPIDDIKESTVAENPELMKFLTEEMIRVNFDMKEYLRILLNTKTYQQEASEAEITPGDEYHFPGPALRRMSPEQVWDSFITLAVFDPEEYQIEPAEIQTKLLDVDLKTATAEDIYKRDLALREVTSYKVTDVRNKPYRYQGLMLVRASEIPLPAPAGHFLRQFGQSDHESIQTSSTGGSVPQVLQMFNGPITHMLLDKKSLMYNNVVAEKKVEEQVNVIFMSILSRKATPEEMKLALDEIKEDKAAGYGNVIWALVNTREFLFIQ